MKPASASDQIVAHGLRTEDEGAEQSSLAEGAHGHVRRPAQPLSFAAEHAQGVGLVHNA